MPTTTDKAERVVTIAAKFYEARGALRGILGENYPKRIRPWMATVRRVAKAERVDILKATMILLEKFAEDRAEKFCQLYVLAAAVEIAEEDAGEK